MSKIDKFEAMLFEGDDFAQECLDAFDSSVAQIEKGYAVTPKSA